MPKPNYNINLTTVLYSLILNKKEYNKIYIYIYIYFNFARPKQIQSKDGLFIAASLCLRRSNIIIRKW